MKKSFLIFSFLFCAFITNAQPNKKLKVLFLGNSYTYVNNLPQLIRDLALANGDTLIFDSNCPGGYTLYNHFTNTTSIAKINSQPWDYVVLQAQSQEPSFPPSQVATQTLPYAIKLDSIVRQNDSCSQTVFFETWGRKFGDASNCPFYPPICTYTSMQDRLKESYKLFADTCHALMSPAGEAWRKSIALDSTLNLYQSDNSHPHILGSYLTACVFYEVLFNKSVIGNSFTSGIAAATVSFLQQIAHGVVNDSLVVWNIGTYNPCGVTTSIINLAVEHDFKLFPNPAGSTLNLSFSNEWRIKSYTYEITDLLGRIYRKDILFSNTISISELPCGIYFLEIKGENKTYKKKFIKQL